MKYNAVCVCGGVPLVDPCQDVPLSDYTVQQAGAKEVSLGRGED